MLGQFNIPEKVRSNYDHGNNNDNNKFNVSINNKKNSQIKKTQSEGCRGKPVFSYREPENKSGVVPRELPLSNVERFLEAITPSVHAQYLSKTTKRGLRTCDAELEPYFLLNDLWGSFKEWSAYGVGVPLVLDDHDSVIQYYVPYLSGIQIYVDPSKSPVKSRQTSEDSDGDYFSRDSSSDGSSDSEQDRELTDSRERRKPCSLPSVISFKMERLLSRDQHTALHDGFSSDEGESVTSQGSLLFQYFEHDPPFCREPLADKVLVLALRFPELKSLRSCDLLSSSWLSVAWYPIYRIPTGPTLKDLDACFLTYHSLYTPTGVMIALGPEGSPATRASVVIYPNEIDGSSRISLPVFGLASYKFRGSLWTSTNGSDRQSVNSLLQAADSWLKLLQVNHPDYLFFSRSR
ncbi:hypothetical protein KSS87_002479 [Heliosperma pusillum]|nr:hypothetical protein KSS87_002479 [Heliosperma pusillum]